MWCSRGPRRALSASRATIAEVVVASARRTTPAPVTQRAPVALAFAPALGAVGADALRKRQATKPRVPATSTSQKADPSLVAIQRTGVLSGSSASTAPRAPGSVRRLT